MGLLKGFDLVVLAEGSGTAGDPTALREGLTNRRAGFALQGDGLRAGGMGLLRVMPGSHAGLRIGGIELRSHEALRAGPELRKNRSSPRACGVVRGEASTCLVRAWRRGLAEGSGTAGDPTALREGLTNRRAGFALQGDGLRAGGLGLLRVMPGSHAGLRMGVSSFDLARRSAPVQSCERIAAVQEPSAGGLQAAFEG
jgi:hypothetical protein